MGWHILWVGLLMGLLSLGVGYAYWSAQSAAWQTMIFMTLTLAQMANVLAIRSERDSLFRIGLRSNRPLLGAVLLTVLLQLAVVYVPTLQAIFSTVALSAIEVGICVALSSLIFWAVELEKWLARRQAGRTAPALDASASAAPSAGRHREREATHG
jgi:P-type Ca2+ transporter type 2C